ncbi:MAG: BolA family transcriptional regulator [Gammaproteobacteria bacterium]|nr:BolA family transcriptional regulator [Gammaproteobacteria bacterium]MCK5497719.1 BolA family transcriptional regulator [Gammaproteobacteria bacterium]
MDRIAEIKARLEQALSPTHIDIIDESHLHAGHAGAASGAGHFNVTITSDKFTGQSAIQRHRMVYLAVDDLMRTEIHALSINAIASDENK